MEPFKRETNRCDTKFAFSIETRQVNERAAFPQ